MSLSIVILAAGKGRRMHSRLPKVLHQLADKPLLEHVINAASGLPHNAIYLVYGHGGEQLRACFPRAELAWAELVWVEQAEPLGTGHAVAQVIDRLPVTDDVLILYGDIPLISHRTLAHLVAAVAETGIALLVARLADASGYGRIVRDAAGEVVGIIEEPDASAEQRRITEVNTGMMVVKAKWLRRWLAALDNANAQAEYYLTDVVAAAVAEKILITTVMAEDEQEIKGVNDRAQLAELERHYQLRQAQTLMRQGVSLRDPARFDCRGSLTTGSDVMIDINAVFSGEVILGSHVTIEPGCQISHSTIGDHVTIKANTLIEDAVIGDHCTVGPFARIRPQTVLAEHVRVGNFVEIKKSTIQRNTRINHLSYVGDSEVGEAVNIGAGTITCNYDGLNKHKTVIGKHVFIGSNAALIAPLVIGDHATVAAGTTVTEDVKPNSLALNRLERKVVEDWRRPEGREQGESENN